MPADYTADAYEDAWGVRCAEPVQCDVCCGTGVDYGETCLRCGGRGEHCERPTP